MLYIFMSLEVVRQLNWMITVRFFQIKCSILFQLEILCFFLFLLLMHFCFDRNTASPMSKRMYCFYLNSFIGRNILLTLQHMRNILENGEINGLGNFGFLRYLCKKLGPSLKIVSLFPTNIWQDVSDISVSLFSFLIKFMVMWKKYNILSYNHHVTHYHYTASESVK